MDKDKIAIYIGSKIKEYRKLKGMTQEELGKKLSIGKSTIANYEKGFRSPKKDMIFQIAEALSVSIDDLFPKISSSAPLQQVVTSKTQPLIEETVTTMKKLNESRQKIVLVTANIQLEEQERDQSKIIKMKKAEIINEDEYIDDIATGLVSAGSGVWQYDYINIEVRFPKNEVPDRYDSIAKVIGRSMEPVIHDADLLFIVATSQVDYNKIGIFQVNGENYVKKLRLGNDGIPYLESINNDFDDIFLCEDDEMRTIGEVVGFYRA